MSKPRTARRVRTRFLALLGALALATAVFALAVVAISFAASPLAAPTITSKPPNPSASTSASFSLSGPGGATFECKFDGAASFTSCTSPKSYPGLATGSHTFRVRAKKSGDTSAETTYTWSIVVPTASITTGPADPTNSQSASFAFTADASDATFECKLDSPTFVLCTSPKSYSGLGAGSHTFQVRAKGSAGTGGPATRIWTIDLTAPGAPTITYPPSSPAWTTTASPAATFTGEAGGTFQCKLDSGSLAACTSPKAYSGLSQGSHTFQVKQTDAAGNSGPAASRTFQIDSIAPPTPTITSKPANPTNATSANFVFSDSEGGVSFLCKLDAGGFVACPPASYGGLSQTSHTFQVKAKDAAGNESAPASWTWVVDTTPPGAPTIILAPVAWPPIGWQSTSAVFAFTGPGDASSYLCRLDGVPSGYAACASPKSYSGLAQGSHTFEVKAVDAAGNVSLTAAPWTFFVDTVAPTKPIFSQTPPDPNSTATSTFAWSSTDPAPASGIAGYLCSKENGAYLPCSSPYTYNVQTTSNGQHQFAVVAVDWAGNISQAASYKWKVAAGTHADFTVAGSVSGLMIGVWKSIPITITNPNSDPISVTILTVTVSGSPNGCDAATNFETQPAVVPFTVPANAVNYAVPLANQPQIRLKNLPGPSPANNQNNCKNQTINLAYSGSANGP